VERNRLLGIQDRPAETGRFLYEEQNLQQEAGFYLKPRVSCRLLDMRDYPAIRGRLLNMRQASRKRHATGFEGQASIKRQAFMIESDQQKEPGSRFDGQASIKRQDFIL
jgi:hypothetical protein